MINVLVRMSIQFAFQTSDFVWHRILINLHSQSVDLILVLPCVNTLHKLGPFTRAYNICVLTTAASRVKARPQYINKLADPALLAAVRSKALLLLILIEY